MLNSIHAFFTMHTNKIDNTYMSNFPTGIGAFMYILRKSKNHNTYSIHWKGISSLKAIGNILSPEKPPH